MVETADSLLPLPCMHSFVVKTADSAGSKVFINMCSAPQVAVPAGFQQGQVHFIASIPHFAFALACGRCRACNDPGHYQTI